jgi:NNP family nitrate/nitrite transporter-like MFS transporter
MSSLLLLVFWSFWFFNFSSRTVLSPLLPLFEHELNITHTLAGSVFFFVSLGYTLSLLVSGWLAVRIGFKKAIIAGVSLLALALFCLTFASSYAYLGLFVTVIGFAAGIYLPSAIPLLTSAIRPEKWGRAIAFHDTAASFSILAIPLMTAAILRFFEWKVIMYILCAGCIISSLVFYVLSPDPQQRDKSRFGFLQILQRKEFWIMAVPWVFAAGSSLGLYNITPLFLLTEKKISLETANTILGLSRVGGFIATFAAGFLADRYGVRKVLLSSIAITGVSTGAVALCDSFPLLVTALAAQATVSTVFFPVGLVTISKITDFNERSLFTGAIVAFSMIFGNGAIPFLLCAVADAWSFRDGILFLGILTALSCTLVRKLPKI